MQEKSGESELLPRHVAAQPSGASSLLPWEPQAASAPARPEAAGAAHAALVPRHTAHQQHMCVHPHGPLLAGGSLTAHRRLGHYRRNNQLSFGSFIGASCNENASLPNAVSC